jgi:DNA helicase-2/ATP-dependent DNA helicase PcrA
MGGTFHAVANLLLRLYGHHVGYAPNFTILDRADAEGIINLIKSSLDLSGAGKRFPSKRVILNIISGSVNKSHPLEEPSAASTSIWLNSWMTCFVSANITSSSSAITD